MLKKFFCSTFIITSSTLFCASESEKDKRYQTLIADAAIIKREIDTLLATVQAHQELIDQQALEIAAIRASLTTRKSPHHQRKRHPK